MSLIKKYQLHPHRWFLLTQKVPFILITTFTKNQTKTKKLEKWKPLFMLALLSLKKLNASKKRLQASCDIWYWIWVASDTSATCHEMADHILSYHQSWPWPGQSSPATHGYWPSDQVNVLLFTSLHTPPTKKSTKFTTICLWRKNINIGCYIFFTATLMWLTHHVSNRSLTHSLTTSMDGPDPKDDPPFMLHMNGAWMWGKHQEQPSSQKKRLQNATNLQRKTIEINEISF